MCFLFATKLSGAMCFLSVSFCHSHIVVQCNAANGLASFVYILKLLEKEQLFLRKRKVPSSSIKSKHCKYQKQHFLLGTSRMSCRSPCKRPIYLMCCFRWRTTYFERFLLPKTPTLTQRKMTQP